MTGLKIELLGPFSVYKDGRPVTAFKTNKVRALLAYLAVEADRPHRRESLVGIFWPEQSEQRARANLSQALYTLRNSLGDDTEDCPVLIIDRATIRLNPDSDLWLDVNEFNNGLLIDKPPLDDQQIQSLKETVDLYKGDFLEGFSLSGSSPFEMYSLTMRERLSRRLKDGLTRLVDSLEGRGEYEDALDYARRLLEMDAWHEEAHLRVMRLLALGGRRSEAMEQYQACQVVLSENLGISPMRRTTAMYESIRDDQLAETARPSRVETGFGRLTPSFLVDAPPRQQNNVFVSRNAELTRLSQLMDMAIDGQGRVAFAAGEAGSGKTFLMHEFARQAMARQPQLLVASGKSTAYTGLGDPYAPFREIVAQLTGDVVTRYAVGTISSEQALRLWSSLPLAVKALAQNAPELIGPILNRSNLLERMSDFANEVQLSNVESRWFERLEKLTEGSDSAVGLIGQHQSALFEQFVRFIEALASHSPLLILLDDLQWADVGTIALLFHLSRNLSGRRILLLGAYRPEEIAFVRDGKRHPLEPVVYEIERRFGDTVLDLGQSDGISFVDAFLDNEPNLLDRNFRDNLLRRTEGHPLFTAELVLDLKEQGELGQDEQGRWMEGEKLDWDRMPSRVEGVIAERLARLPDRMQRLLQAASVQGESFIAEVVARTVQVDEDETIWALGGLLGQEHRLVRAQSLDRVVHTGERYSTYQFHHFLFHQYLYDNLDAVEKGRHHEAVGKALLRLFGDQVSDKSHLLAHHYESANVVDKAIYFRLQAGNYAIKLSATEEAIEHFSRGLALLQTLPPSPERDQMELALQLGFGTGHQLLGGYAAPEAYDAYERALDICRHLGPSPQLVSALWPLATHAAMISDYPTALSLAEQGLDVARRLEDPLFICVAHHHLGWILYQRGRFVESDKHQDDVIAYYKPEFHDGMVQMFGHDFGITSLGWSSWPLWYLGYPDKALSRCYKALALAERFDHPHSLMHAYQMTALVHSLRGELIKAGEFGDRVMALALAHGFLFYTAGGVFFQGVGLVGQGRLVEAIDHMRKSLDIYESMGTTTTHRGTLSYMAGLHAAAGQIELAQQTLAEAEAIEVSDYTDGILERLRGELFFMGGQTNEAEACFNRAIDIARSRQARSSELSATTSLCRLWQVQGRNEEARVKLRPIYDWFTEGLDTAPLQEAAALLQELA